MITGNCVKCGTWRQSLHRDHIIAKCNGGSDDPSNIQLLCANCHEDKTREDLTGRTISEETRAKIKGHPHRGPKHHSPETRAKIGEARKGQVFTPETRAKMSTSAKESSKRGWETRRRNERKT